jgi:hypothetical protein
MQPVSAKLFYVLAFVPAEGSNQFFVMNQQQVTSLIGAELKRLGRADDYPVTGIVWKLVLAY